MSVIRVDRRRNRVITTGLIGSDYNYGDQSTNPSTISVPDIPGGGSSDILIAFIASGDAQLTAPSPWTDLGYDSTPGTAGQFQYTNMPVYLRAYWRPYVAGPYSFTAPGTTYNAFVRVAAFSISPAVNAVTNKGTVNSDTWAYDTTLPSYSNSSTGWYLAVFAHGRAERDVTTPPSGFTLIGTPHDAVKVNLSAYYQAISSSTPSASITWSHPGVRVAMGIMIE